MHEVPDLARLRGVLDAAASDTSRICPAFFGTVILDGEQLRVRTPKGEFRVSARAELLRQIVDECNGENSIDEIMARCPSHIDAADLRGLLGHLLDRGALVDGIHALSETHTLAWQNIPVGREAPDSVTSSIGELTWLEQLAGLEHAEDVRQTVLDELFARRATARAFGASDIAQDTLLKLLWASAGCISDQHPNRTGHSLHRNVASPGAMYLVQWTLVLTRAVGRYEPGVYSLRFPGAKKVALQCVSRDVTNVFRTMTRPWHLIDATGILVAHGNVRLASLRYRNRAMQLLQLEVGASMQNLALVAAGEDVGLAVVGGYCEEDLAKLCRLGSDSILGLCLFGSQVSDAERQGLPKVFAIDFSWADHAPEIYPLPFHLARARPKGALEDSYNTWGRDADPYMAYVKAHAEAVERQGLREPKEIVCAPAEDLRGETLMPAQLCTYTSEQFERADFPFRAVTAKTLLPWVAGSSLDGGKPIYVPADFVFRRQQMLHLLPTDVARPPMAANSSGCAAGATFDDSAYRALLEVIERDAFMRHWLTQQPGVLVPDDLLPASVANRVGNLRRAGCITTVQLLHARIDFVCLVSAVNDERQFTCVAAAGRPDIEQAALGALDEVETMVYTRLAGQPVRELSPPDVATPEDHALFYAQAKYYRCADAILNVSQRLDRLPCAASGSFSAALDRLAAIDLKAYAVDLTPAQNHIEQGKQPLRVTKIVVPSLVPMTFGFGAEPRAMVDWCDPRSHIPHPFP